MNEKEENTINNKPVSKNALLSFVLGILSIVVTFIGVLATLLIEDLGAVSVLTKLTVPLSVAALILGIIARRENLSEKSRDYFYAKTGLIIGISMLAAVILFMVGVAVFFGLMLSEQAMF